MQKNGVGLRAARVDANQAEIVKELRSVGAFVQSLAQIGKGCPDVLCAYRNVWHVFEIKDGSQVLSKQKLTPDEVLWHARAKGCGPVHVVKDVEQALKIIGAIK